MPPPATYLDSHALDVIQAVNDTLNIASMPQLVARGILLKDSAVNVVIGWVAVGVPVEEKRVKGEFPIFGGCCVVVSFRGRIVQRVHGVFILVKVVVDVGWIVPEPLYQGRQDECEKNRRHGE